MSWKDELQQASFRGIPFAVLGGEGRFGRRVAVHQYPNRDKPYVEDMGRSMRRINVVGFLVEDSLVYGGGSVISQRESMVAAAEAPGPAILVHPTYGQLTVSIPDGGLAVTERWDTGRYFEIGFSFIESGDRIFPSISAVSGSFLDSLADALGASSALDFVRSMTATVNLGLGIVRGVISLGNAIVGTVVGVAANFATLVGQGARDATSLVNLASLLTGNFGRYVNANVSSAFQSGQASSGTPITIATLTAQGAENRQAVADASDAFNAAAAAADATSLQALATASATLTGALGTAVVNPGDGVRLQGGLASYTPDMVTPGADQISQGQLYAQAAFAALLRRFALADMLRAASTYVPSSYDDAVAIRNTVTDAIDAEILIAGDAGDDATYTALRNARQAVVALLSATGADLASLEQFTFRASLPALNLAYRLYQDANRSDQLVDEAAPIHPAFMPTRFRALSS